MIRSRKILADRINNLCKEQGITYYALSYKSAVPLTTLLHIVNGSTKNPGIFTIHKICEGFEISLKDFFPFLTLLFLFEHPLTSFLDLKLYTC